MAQEVGQRPNETEQQNATTLKADANRADAINQSIHQNNSSGSSSAYNDIGNAASASLHELGEQLTHPGLSQEFLDENERRWQAEIKRDEEVRASNAAANAEASRTEAKAEYFRQLWALADKNDVHALETLYRVYHTGDGMIQDEKFAHGLLLRAVALGSDYACQELEGSEPDQQRLVEQLTTAAEAGSHYAKYVVGTTLILGKGTVAKDWRKAMEWCARWADTGDEWCQKEAMFGYRFGQGMPADVDRAAPWMLSLARSGSDEILVDYINLVSAAQLKAPDAAGALEVLRARAAAGHALPAQERLLALRVINGGPLQADPTTGLALLHIAIDHGSVDAQCDLGELQQRGQAVPRDEAAAHQVFVGLSAKSPRAQCLQARDLLHGTGVTADVAKGLRLLQLSADQHWPEAQYQWALRLVDGDGVPRDEAQAVVLVTAAADAGHVAAQNLAARWVVTAAHGIRQDSSHAVEWARQAAAQGSLESAWMLGHFQDDPQRPAELAAGRSAIRRAGAGGFGPAEYDLGMWQMAGDHDTPKGEAAGVVNLQSASAHGCALAQELIGRWKLTGEHGLPKDPSAAIALFKAAAAQGCMPAKRGLAVCLLRGIGTACDGAAAEALLIAAGDADDYQSTLILGVALIDGDTALAADPARGWTLVQDAARAGDGALRIRLADHLLAQPGERIEVLAAALDALRSEEDGGEPAEVEHWVTIYRQLSAFDPERHPTLLQDQIGGHDAVAGRKEAWAMLAHPPADLSEDELLRRVVLKLNYAARWGDVNTSSYDLDQRYGVLHPGIDLSELLKPQEALMFREAGQKLLAEVVPGKSRLEVCQVALFELHQAADLGDAKAPECIAAERAEFMKLQPDANFDELYGPEPAADQKAEEATKP